MSVDYWPQIITGAAGLLGTIVGSAATVGTQIIFRLSDHKEKSKSLAFVIAAEIDSYIKLMEKRAHLREGEEVVQRLRAGENVPITHFGDAYERRPEYFPMFHAHLSSIGVLGAEICRSLAAFHRENEAVICTAEAAQRGEYEHLSASQKADLIEGELEIWRGAINKGRALVDRLYRM